MVGSNIFASKMRYTLYDYLETAVYPKMSHQARDIPKDAALEGMHEHPEDISKKAQGHKANLSNPSQFTIMHSALNVGVLIMSQTLATSPRSNPSRH